MPIVNNEFEYSLPEIVEKNITKELLETFKKKLDEKYQAHENDETPTFLNFYVYLESTEGWKECLQKACVDTGKNEIFEYFAELDWYDAELFADELSLLMVEKKVIVRGADPETEEYLKK